MATIKSYTDLEQSKKLEEILPIESADMFWLVTGNIPRVHALTEPLSNYSRWESYPCWSLVALLKYLSEIKPQVYIPLLFPSEGKWILQFVEYGHGNVCEVSCNNPIDACYELMLKLYELNLL